MKGLTFTAFHYDSCLWSVCKFLFFHFLLICMLQEKVASVPNSLKMLILVSSETLYSILYYLPVVQLVSFAGCRNVAENEHDFSISYLNYPLSYPGNQSQLSRYQTWLAMHMQNSIPTCKYHNQRFCTEPHWELIFHLIHCTWNGLELLGIGFGLLGDIVPQPVPILSSSKEKSENRVLVAPETSELDSHPSTLSSNL